MATRRASADEQLRLMTKVARLYHEHGVRQPEIARRLHVSQARVSRLLKEAEQKGIVRTTVIVPDGVQTGVEEATPQSLAPAITRRPRMSHVESKTLPSFRLDDQVALVTGASSGIGQAIAVGLAASGARVGCLDRGDLNATLDTIGDRGLALTADVTDAAALHAAVAEVERELGALRLAVNCAGIANAAPAEEMDAAMWQTVIDVNLGGVFKSCQAEGRALLRNGGGAIVNIASMSGSIVNRGLTQVHYNASKAGVIQLSKSLAMEWAPHGIRVNTISPGYTATPMNTRPEVADQVKQFEGDTPLGRMATPEEMVGPAVFLLSDAASFCTGTDLLVDGGFVCW